MEHPWTSKRVSLSIEKSAQGINVLSTRADIASEFGVEVDAVWVARAERGRKGRLAMFDVWNAHVFCYIDRLCLLLQ